MLLDDPDSNIVSYLAMASAVIVQRECNVVWLVASFSSASILVYVVSQMDHVVMIVFPRGVPIHVEVARPWGVLGYFRAR